MPLSNSVKLLRALREIVLGSGSGFPVEGTEPKPVFQRAQPALALPRATPESQGLSSHVMEGLYRDISAAPHTNAHALLVARNGRVVSEGYFSPFDRRVWHVSHSLCKTFTGTAVGLAVQEGYFSLDDMVAEYFPDKIGLIVPKGIRSITVRHLLTMTSGISYNEISEVMDAEWLKGIFSSPVVFTPGSQFVYNSMNSYLLSALVQRTTGMPMAEYLAERVFEPMGFGPIAFERSPEGIEKGGWGMYITIEDMVKFGQLYLQKGEWTVDGKRRQLIPAEWIEEATVVQATGKQNERYGYHLWIDSDDGAYIMNGMFGQYITVLPKQNMVVAMTSGNPYVFTDSPAHTILRHYFYSKELGQAALPENPNAFTNLQYTTNHLRFRVPAAQGRSRPARFLSRAQRWQNIQREKDPSADERLQAFCGTTWQFPKNRAGLLPVIMQVTDNNFSSGVRAVHLEPQDDTLLLYWEEQNGTLCLPLGLKTPQRKSISLGNERFIVGLSAKLKQNEDDADILLVEVAFLEHSSCRLLKLYLDGPKLCLRLAEEPALEVAVESVIAQTANTNGAKGDTRPGGSLLNSGYVNHRIQQLCTPYVVGEPV